MKPELTAAERERHENNAKAYQAWINGDPVECTYKNGVENQTCFWGPWDLNEPPNFERYWFRPVEQAPAPKVRQWSKPEDVPGPVCWIRGIGDYRQQMIVGFAGDVAYITVTCGCQPQAHSCDFATTRWTNMEYSTDRKTWKKCEVTE